MDIYNELNFTKGNRLWITIYTLTSRLYRWIKKMKKRHEETTTKKELSELPVWLRQDLGIGDDGVPLNDKPESVETRTPV